MTEMDFKVENLNRLITSKSIELGVDNLPTKKTEAPEVFAGEFYQITQLEKTCPHKNLHKNDHSSIIHNSQKVDTAKCASVDAQVSNT